MILFDTDTISKAWDDIAEENEEIRIILIGKEIPEKLQPLTLC